MSMELTERELEDCDYSDVIAESYEGEPVAATSSAMGDWAVLLRDTNDLFFLLTDVYQTPDGDVDALEHELADTPFGVNRRGGKYIVAGS